MTLAPRTRVKLIIANLHDADAGLSVGMIGTVMKIDKHGDVLVAVNLWEEGHTGMGALPRANGWWFQPHCLEVIDARRAADPNQTDAFEGEGL